MVSPLSAYVVLGLTANGARGKTLEHMLLALENNNISEINNINKKIIDIIKTFSSVEMSNAIMTKQKPKQSFYNAVALYESTVEPLKSLQQINNWCNLKTHGKIKKILDRLPPLTIMLLLNAIYFKGTWKTEFDEKNTVKDIFFNFNDESQKKIVDKMYVKEEFNYYEDREVQAVELPYREDSMSAIIILPNRKININDYISDLNDEKLQHLIKRLNSQLVEIAIPKFEIELNYTLNGVLTNMGMVLPFRTNADFTGLIDGSAHIDRVIQKNYLSIDEKGSEAASVTVVIIRTKGLNSNPQIFIDRPFLFMIRNKNLPQDHEILFIAKIEKF